MIDIEGNVYQTVKIGNQVWTTENLKVTRYNDGTAIPNIIDTSAWENNSLGAYCYYNNDSVANAEKYGALYNWYAVNTGKLAPAGWHVPTDEEWNELEEYLIANGYNWDGTKIDNKIAKSLASKSGWKSSDIGNIGNDMKSNNRTGFSALPGGYRDYNGNFSYIGYHGHWWSAAESYAPFAYSRCLCYGYEHLIRSYNYKECGFSVRLVKD